MDIALTVKLLFWEWGWFVGDGSAKLDLVKLEGAILTVGVKFRIAVWR